MGTFGDGTPNFHSYSAAIWFESVHAGLEVLCHVINNMVYYHDRCSDPGSEI